MPAVRQSNNGRNRLHVCQERTLLPGTRGRCSPFVVRCHTLLKQAGYSKHRAVDRDGKAQLRLRRYEGRMELVSKSSSRRIRSMELTVVRPGQSILMASTRVPTFPRVGQAPRYLTLSGVIADSREHTTVPVTLSVPVHQLSVLRVQRMKRGELAVTD